MSISAMFDNLLVANRGEIACRIIATARRMGIRTIAVYSDADSASAHVEAADEAVRIGSSAPSHSYLNIDAILRAAEKTGAAAVHPGYGFLSENTAFAAAIRGAGMIFVGPPVGAIRTLGDKSKARSLAVKTKIPVIPGYHGAGQTLDRFLTEAAAIGYPVLVKAAFGGGGRGMRIVETDQDLGAALDSAAGEARTAFGDGRLIVEKYVPNPRHIEVQIFSDRSGACVHMGTRDCSVQRRYQKLIEEAPAPNLAPTLEKKMTRAAIVIAGASKYEGAGTVEFIVDRDENFYFMEMNTRLQVEHPVTECVTGEDLVEWQLRVAAGEKLPKSQRQITFVGHAVEARICAENPAEDFLPSAGRLIHFDLPGSDYRIDTGFRSGDAVSVYYDSLVAKLIATGPTRKAAVADLRRGLDEVRIAGPATNIVFLRRIAEGLGFAAGRYDTGLVARGQSRLTGALQLPTKTVLAAAATAVWIVRSQAATSSGAPAGPWSDRGGWRLGGVQPTSVSFGYGQTHQHALTASADIVELSDSKWRVVLADEPSPMNVVMESRPKPSKLGNADRMIEVAHRLIFKSAGRQVEFHHVKDADTHFLFHVGDPVPFVFGSGVPDVVGPGATAQIPVGLLTAPMPGRIARVAVRVGDPITAGDLLMVLEAMKMEHAIVAPVGGVVDEIFFEAGASVARGAELLRVGQV
jgi:3-methylcrotonyl-CoA carboxylase alpha subunit